MKSYRELANSVIIDSRKNILMDYDDLLELAGEGRSAFVFRIKGTDKAIKVFFPAFTHIAQEESEIYKALQGDPYYPVLYDSGTNYLVIDYIRGLTLFQCIARGIPVTPEKIREIDKALNSARKKGLNPSDIHLRNIFITAEGQVKLIDVARFRQTKTCSQWNDLKMAFYKYYMKPYFPKRIPEMLLNTIAALYKKNLIPGMRIKEKLINWGR
ncbi:protein kinase family protein [Peribacillus saganii]|uniref:Protein kinase family protein n=1 Tax=Peribacillus saganii TaxID=2303992 RepID=A0A372LM15_9BACI|nr:protein kinase family protein [Peribacillus saganii]RFU68134.1 protein kinase family protein [Peribacillus saganii]